MKTHSETEAVGPLALYVHIPFCATKCPYCDFNTYAGIESLIPAYVTALRRELDLWGSALRHPLVKTVFLGGGTPSYLPAEETAALMDTIRSAFELEPAAEITLEANPDDLDHSKLAAFLDAGVNRLSIGVQSLDDRLLEVLGRRHSASDAVAAYRMAVEAGFGNVSIDLMYGLPYQTAGDWQRTLDGAVALAPPHMSMYCLTLEDGTPLKQAVESGRTTEPDPDLAADMYLAAQEAMRREGYRHYEISNWAQAGFEGRHNITYWRNRPYLGVGPGAHSYIGSLRFFNLRSPKEYIGRLRGGQAQVRINTPGHSREAIKAVPVVEGVETVDHRLEMAETLMLGLRLDEGIGVAEFKARFGVAPAEAYGDEIGEAASLELLDITEDRLRLTHRGRMFSNEVFRRFFE